MIINKGIFMSKKVYIYNPNADIKNVFVTEVEVGPYDIIDNSTEKEPLKPKDGYIIVFDIEKDKWIYQFDTYNVFYDPETGDTIDNKLSREHAKLSASDFGLKSLKDLVTTPPPERDTTVDDWVEEKYKWNYKTKQWDLKFDEFKATALKTVAEVMDRKIDELTKGISDKEKETYELQYNEALIYSNLKSKKFNENEIKKQIPNLYELVKSRFNLDDSSDNFKQFLDDKVEKIISRANEYKQKKMAIVGTYQAFKDKVAACNTKKEIIATLHSFKDHLK